MFRRHEIGQAPIRRAVVLHNLLAQEMECGQHLGPRFIRVQFHIVARPVRREEAIHAARLDQFFTHHLFQERLRVGKQLARLFAVFLVLEDLRINPAQLPSVEKRRPVNERDEG